MIFYEAPHRVKEMLLAMQALSAELPLDRRIVVARELTKRYETIHYGTVEELVSQLEQKALTVKGEFVLLVEGRAEYAARKGLQSSGEVEEEMSADEKDWMRLLSQSLPKKEVAKLLAQKLGKPKRAYYQWLLDN